MILPTAPNTYWDMIAEKKGFVQPVFEQVSSISPCNFVEGQIKIDTPFCAIKLD
jgi:hypothetical protein